MPWLSYIVSNVLLALLLAITAWFVQQRLGRPGVARVLWVFVLVKLVAPPIVSLPIVELPSTMACALGVCSCAHVDMPTMLGRALPGFLFLVWLAGAGAAFMAAWRRWAGFQRLIASAHPATPQWQSMAARLSAELAVRRAPEILVVPGRLPPLVVPGWRRPRILLPRDLLDRLTSAQRESLLLHEMVHIQRGDHLVRLLELTVCVACWWLPLVGSAGRQLRACEETCCDEAVVAKRPQARREYASLLLDVLDFTNSMPPQAVPQATAMSTASNLEHRLRAILESNRRTRATWLSGALAVGVVCTILPCGVTYEFAVPESVGQPASVARTDNTHATALEARWTGCDPPPIELPIYVCPQ